jgi:hypothetical protein
LNDLSGAFRFDESTSAKFAEAARAIEQRNAQVAESISANWSPVIVQRQLLEAANIGERIAQQLRFTELAKLNGKLTDAIRLPEIGAIGAQAANITAESQSGFQLQTPQVIRPFPSFEIIQSPANDAPHIIEPTAEDITAIAHELPITARRQRGNAPYHALHWDRAYEIFMKGFRTGPYQIASDIVGVIGWTKSRNDAEKGMGVLGNSEDAACRALALEIKLWISAEWEK